MPRLPDVKRFVSNTSVVIYRIPCQVMPEFSARVYLLLGAGPPTLVDTGSGFGQSTAQILAGLEAVRSDFGEPVGLRDVRRILITHGHVDHVGGLPELHQKTGAAVAIHELDSRVLRAHRERAAVGRRKLRHFLQQAGVEPPDQEKLLGAYGSISRDLPKIPVEFTLEDGAELDGLRFLHTPGHSPGHVCITAGDVLLSGDHVLSHKSTQQWPESINPYTGIGHYLDSLEKVRRLEGIGLVLGGHEAPLEDLGARIEEIRRTQFRRIDRVLDVLRRAGPMTVSEIARELYPRAVAFHVMLALQDTGARVEYLHQRGRLVIANLEEVEGEESPVYRYEPA